MRLVTSDVSFVLQALHGGSFHEELDQLGPHLLLVRLYSRGGGGGGGRMAADALSGGGS